MGVSLSLLQRSSQPRDPTQVSHIAGGFFTSWATREAQEHWSGKPIPSPGDLPNTRMELGSPALQTDSLPTELQGPAKCLQILSLSKISLIVLLIFFIILVFYSEPYYFLPFANFEFSLFFLYFLGVLSHFSHVRVFVTPRTMAHQTPLSMDFSRQEYWSGLKFPSPYFLEV